MAKSAQLQVDADSGGTDEQMCVSPSINVDNGALNTTEAPINGLLADEEEQLGPEDNISKCEEAKQQLLDMIDANQDEQDNDTSADVVIKPCRVIVKSLQPRISENVSVCVENSPDVKDFLIQIENKSVEISCYVHAQRLNLDDYEKTANGSYILKKSTKSKPTKQARVMPIKYLKNVNTFELALLILLFYF